MHLQTEEADDALGASAIEIGLEMASVRREVTDLPPGPDTDASAASPQLAEQKAEVKETELPQDKPTEPEEADRVVTENESKKPKEDDPKIAAVQTQASTESVAAEATATPSSDAIPEGAFRRAGDRHRETARRVRATWQKELIAHLDKHKRYPTDRSQKSAEIQIVSRSTGRGTCSRPTSRRVRAIPRLTRPHWRWCAAPTRCLRRRRR